MTDNKIIKALENCIDQGSKCAICLYNDDGEDQCFDKLKKDAITLITHQKAEIESLQATLSEIMELVTPDELKGNNND